MGIYEIYSKFYVYHHMENKMRQQLPTLTDNKLVFSQRDSFTQPQVASASSEHRMDMDNTASISL